MNDNLSYDEGNVFFENHFKENGHFSLIINISICEGNNIQKLGHNFMKKNCCGLVPLLRTLQVFVKLYTKFEERERESFLEELH